MNSLQNLATAVLMFGLGACQLTGGSNGSVLSVARGAASATRVRPDLPVARAPFRTVEVSWKQRLPQAYLYLEGTGSYTRIGGMLEELHARMDELGLAASGPPFGLFYDDPGSVPLEQLRLRACFPVDTRQSPPPPLAYDVLPSVTVVYAFVGGEYPEVPRAYPALFSFMGELGWVETGPVREAYLVNPSTVENYDQLVCEVQVPATVAN